jgi:hypothetical protein
MPWITPLSALISGSTTIATPIGSCSARVAGRSAAATESCGAFDHDCRDWHRCALLLRLPLDFDDCGLDRDQQYGRGSAIDRERTIAQRCDLDCSA